MSWIIRKILGVGIFIIVFLASLELASFIATKMKLFPINAEPTYYLTGLLTDMSGMEWRNQKESWGAWHKPNATSRHASTCFDVTYRSNSIGARDKEFARIATTNRWLLLGDSFAEGYGVNFENTSKYLIEKQLGVDILNFGTANYFGPLQYYLIYRELGLKFQHDGLIIYFLPANDFTDNDYSVWEQRELGQTKSYRPYYRHLDNGNYEIFYPKGSMPRDNIIDSEMKIGSVWDSFKLFAHKFLWSANVIRAVKIVFFQASTPATYSGYFDASQEQQAAAVHWIHEILDISPARKILLVSIPSSEDLERIRSGESPENQFWFTEFKELTRQRNNFNFLDLAVVAPKTSKESIFLKCDEHWSPEGNRWAANEITKALKGLEP